MKSADAFIAPALWHEPFGRIVVEAMAVGALPIISARGGMYSDIVTNNKSGLVVDPPSPKAFASTITAIISDKKKSKALSKGAKLEFNTKFNEENILNQYLKLYSNALENFKKKHRN